MFAADGFRNSGENMKTGSNFFIGTILADSFKCFSKNNRIVMTMSLI